MSDGYLKFKKRFLIFAVIKSVIFGLSIGILTSSVIILLQKLIHNSVSPFIAVLCGVGAFAVSAGLLFLILFPRDRHLAKRLDNELALGEKTQTMLEFINDESDMVRIQREDTNERLKSLPTNALKQRRIWLNVIAPVLAVAVLMPAILIPLKADTTPPPYVEPDVEATAWQKTAVIELIAYVEASALESAPKAEVLEQLNALLVSLETSRPESEMRAYVISIIFNVSRAIDAANSYNDVALGMLESENEYIKNLAAAIGSLAAVTVRQELDLINSKVTKAEIAEFAEEFKAVLAPIVVPADDTLLPAIVALANRYAEIAADMDSYSDQWFTSNVTGALNTAYEAMSPEILAQFENENVRKYVIIRLMNIFGITEDELPEEVRNSFSEGEDFGDDSKYDDDDKDDSLNSGGYGNADQIFGSNDTVYDPETNTHVSYGQLLNAYYAKVKEQLMAGGTTDSLAEFIDAYFSSLYDGSKKDDTTTDK